MQQAQRQRRKHRTLSQQWCCRFCVKQLLQTGYCVSQACNCRLQVLKAGSQCLQRSVLLCSQLDSCSGLQACCVAKQAQRQRWQVQLRQGCIS